MILFKSRIKWIALFVLFLSMASLLIHLFIAKSSSVNIVAYSALTDLSQDFASFIGSKGSRNKKLWGVVKPLVSLQPYANPRGNYPAPSELNNGYIYAKVFGGFEKIRSSICDLVTISRLLNATLVIPEIQESTRSKGISYKFKSFSYLYDEEQFIASLKDDIIVVKSLPESLKLARKRNEFPTFKPKSSASLKFYIQEVLPKLKKTKVIGLVLNDGGCLQSILPPSMAEFQRLRCRVAYHALKFRPEIHALGRRMLERLKAWGQPFLAFHPGLKRDRLAYHGCAEIFQDIHTELIQYQRAQMIKRGIVSEEISIESHIRKLNGSCPLMPEEVGILLRAMGYPTKTIIYLAGSETFGGQRVLIPLRAMFPNLVDRTSLCSQHELLSLIGPETPLPSDDFHMPPPKSEKQLKEEWNKAGSRPRPLPPPPGRPMYRHEKEGWYGWITVAEKEPDPSPSDLRMQAHRLLWDALDYIVSVEADAFFPGFNNDGSGWPDFSSLVMGHRSYEIASTRTYRPDRKSLSELLNITHENMYHPARSWTLQVRDHLNKSLGEDGFIRQSILSKSVSFLSHPLPECSCRIPSADFPAPVKGDDGRFIFGGEDECPKWMKHERDESSEAAGEEEGKNDENDFPEYGDNFTEEAESNDGGKVTGTQTLDQDEEMDPND